MINVLNRKDSKGIPGTFVGRPSALGNPFIITGGGERASAIQKYETWLRQQIEDEDRDVMEAFLVLLRQARRGDVNLICFCAPEPCHADVIKKILEEML